MAASPDSSAPQRSAAEIVAGLDLDTRIGLVSGKSFWHLQPVPSAGLREIMVTDGPHGLRRQETSADHLGLNAARPATCFPTAAALGSSWDEDLISEVGAALGDEAKDQGVSVILGPGLNLKRHPAGGRSFEYLSEDPLVSGKLAAALVRGVQSRGVGTSIKHYAANNHESHRLVMDVIVDERTLRELYLRGFEIAVKESAPWTVMCSYNKVNGTYASEHHELLTTILREDWGFEGLVMTDWGAANDRVAGIKAGLDLEMPGSNGSFAPEIRAALDSGRLSRAELDACATRVVELIRKGQQPAPVPADYDAHHQLARRAAAAGSVLLRNEGLLPLTPSGTIALIGEFAREPRYQGAGSSQVTATRIDDAFSAIRARVGSEATVTYARGYEARSGETSAELIEEAVSAALAADTAVVFAGLPASHESEGFDRTTLDMPAGHVRLIEAVAATGTPVVVVLSNGGVVHLPFVDRVGALLECWLGGQAGGSAVADVLFGDAEPGGRLAESIPFNVAQLPADRNFPGLPRQVQYREGLYVGYRFHDSAAVPAQFPFGFGLSYTSFDWSGFSLEPDEPGGASGPSFRVSLEVTNDGQRAGSDVVQVYVRKVDSVVYRPDKELKGFAKVHLEPGASTTVTVPLQRDAFTIWDVASGSWAVEAGVYEVIVARSSTDAVHSFTVTVDSEDEVTPAAGPAAFVASDAEFTALLGRSLPAVDQGRPFHRNSTLDDVSTTRAGRAFANQVIRIGLQRAQQEFPDPDDATVKMFRAALGEGPLRGLVLMGGGVISFETLDRLIEAFNGEWLELGRNLVEGVKGRLRS